MAHNEHKYFMIFNVSELHLIDFSEVEEDSPNTVTKSIDETLTFVKWEGIIIPPTVEALTSKQGAYNYNEFLTILTTPEWSEEVK